MTSSKLYHDKENNGDYTELMDRLRKASDDLAKTDAAAVVVDMRSAPYAAGTTVNMTVPKTEVRFRFVVGKKGDRRISIDGSAIDPNSEVRLSASFDVGYYKQLNDIVYSSEQTVDFAKIVSILNIYDYAVANKGKVFISSTRHVSKLKLIAQTLTSFFNENDDVISSIATMVNNRTEKPVNA